jgi:hypothetical protein
MVSAPCGWAVLSDDSHHVLSPDRQLRPGPAPGRYPPRWSQRGMPVTAFGHTAPQGPNSEGTRVSAPGDQARKEATRTGSALSHHFAAQIEGQQ